MMRLFLPLLCALTLAGCAGLDDPAAQHSQPYRAGYEDGCAAATGAGTATYKDTPVRNNSAYQTVPSYRAGWNSGYLSCRRTPTGQGTGQPSILSQPGPGH
ncbi:MAG: hypothetical protein ACP5QR_03115 [Rhizomicrobium sp.]